MLNFKNVKTYEFEECASRHPERDFESPPALLLVLASVSAAAA
jgi:hypothetical protein